MRELLMSLLLVLIGAGCASGDGTASAASEWGLDGVMVPTSQDEVNVVFLAMPAELEGMTAERDDPEHVGFVHYVGADAEMGVSWQELAPNRALAVELLEEIDQADEFSTTAKDLDSESGPVLLQGAVDDNAPETHMLYWGDPSDGWVFFFTAETAEQLDSLVEAFVAAAGTG